MEVARHWRLNSQRLRFTGLRRECEEGVIEVSLNGANWIEASHNGHKKHEDPLQEVVIYQAPPVAERELIPLQISGSVEISASTS